MKNKWYKNKWFWLWGAICIIILGALGGNIAILLCLKKAAQEQSAWLTLFGGWLGFLATLIVGLIACVMNCHAVPNRPDEFVPCDFHTHS